MKEDFVTFELAQKLKEKGFKEPCMNASNPFECTYRNGWCEYLEERDDEFIHESDLKEGDLLLPTISQVLKWLREEKEMYITIIPYATCSTRNRVAYYFRVQYNSDGITMQSYEDGEIYCKWPDCALAGIEYVLDNLI